MVVLFSTMTGDPLFLRVDYFNSRDYPKEYFRSERAPLANLLDGVLTFLRSSKMPARLVFEKDFPSNERQLITNVIELYNIARPHLL